MLLKLFFLYTWNNWLSDTCYICCISVWVISEYHVPRATSYPDTLRVGQPLHLLYHLVNVSSPVCNLNHPYEKRYTRKTSMYSYLIIFVKNMFLASTGIK